MSENSYKAELLKAQEDIALINTELGKIDATLTTLSTKTREFLKAFNGKSPQAMSEGITKAKKAIDDMTKSIKQQEDAMKKREAQVKAESEVRENFARKQEAEEKRSFQNLVNSSRARKKLSAEELAAMKAREAQVNKESKVRESLARQRKREEAATLRQINADKKAAAAKERLNGAYNKLVAKQQQALSTLQNLLVAKKRDEVAIKRATALYAGYTARVNQANLATKNLASNRFAGLIAGAKNLMAAFGLIGGVFLIAQIVRSVFELTKKLQSLNFAMKTIIPDAIEMGRTQRFLLDISKRYGASIVTLTERYTKFYAAAKQSNIAMKDTEQIFESLTKAAGVLGLKKDELNGVFLAVEQMISKGKVTTEELRRQLGERLPGAFGIMAAAVGVTVSELDRMLRAGEILSSVALPKFAVALEQAYGIQNVTEVDTLVAAQERLTTSWVNFIATINGEGGAGGGAIKIFEGLGAIMNQLSERVDAFYSTFESGYTVWDKVKIKVNAMTKMFGLFDGVMYDNVEAIKAAKIAADELYSSMQLEGKFNVTKDNIEGLTYQIKEQEAIMLDLIEAQKGIEDERERSKIGEEIENTKDLIEQLTILRQVRINELPVPFDFATSGRGAGARSKEDVKKELEAEILIKDAYDKSEQSAIKASLAIIEGLEEELKAWENNTEAKKKNGKETKVIIEGSIASMEELISTLQDEQNRLAITTESWKDYESQINGVQAKIEDLKIGLKSVNELLSTNGIDISLGGDDGNKSLTDKIANEKAASAIIRTIKENDYTYLAEIENDELDRLKQHAQEQIDLAKDLSEEEQKIIENKNKEELDALEEQQKRRREAIEEGLELEKELRSDFADSAIELGSSLLDARVEQVDQEIEKNKEKYAAILDDETLSTEQRAAIEAERDKKEIELEKKKRKRENEAFLFKQALALAEIGINLAKTISAINLAAANIAATVPFPFGAVAGAAFAATNIPIAVASAAIQAGAVAAQTISAFETGTENAPKGLAMVDEKRPEVHTDKHGNIKSFGSDKGANLRMLEQGDKIYKSHNDYFDKVGMGDMERAIFSMNMQSNGQTLSEKQVDNIMSQEMKGLRVDMNRLGKDMRKIASRPINNTVKVNLEDRRAY